MGRMANVLSRFGDELGITSLITADWNVHLLMLTRVVRMFAYGSSTLVLALYLSALGHSDSRIGLFMTLTLVGDVLISLVLTLFADSLGRRRVLILGALLMVLSGSVFATLDNYWILLAAAVFGVISPSGNEIGPFRAVEESTIAHLTTEKSRPDIFALYVVGGTLGTSFGSLTSGWLTQGLQAGGWSAVASFRVVFWLYAIAGVFKTALSLYLSSKCEVDRKRSTTDDSEVELTEQNAPLLDATASPEPVKRSMVRLSPASQRTLVKLCGLFFFDSLASGMVPASLIAFFFSRKFGISEGSLGTIIAVSQFVSSLGNILASAVARRIGLVYTMVFTHLPSAIFLAMIPMPNMLWLAIVLLVARSSLSSMDQAPRSAFLSAIVLPEERTSVMGIVNTVKTMSQSAGPSITGILAANGRFWIAFVVAGALKASYDVAMLNMFASRPKQNDSDTSVQDTEHGSAPLDRSSPATAHNPARPQ